MINLKIAHYILKGKGYNQEIIPSKIILDGGAIEVLGDLGIGSDRVLRDNSSLEHREVLEKIKKVLKLKRLIVVPEYPYEYTGHVNGIARFID